MQCKAARHSSFLKVTQLKVCFSLSCSPCCAVSALRFGGSAGGGINLPSFTWYLFRHCCALRRPGFVGMREGFPLMYRPSLGWRGWAAWVVNLLLLR
jgi:hypothetical protein